MSKRILISLIAVMALVVAVLPVDAATVPAPRPRITAFNPAGSTLSIQANTTFYVYHGFRTVAGDSTPNEIMQSQFNLSVDGVKQKGTIVWEYSDTKPRVVTGKFYQYDFIGGLPPGTYIFHFEFIFQGKIVPIPGNPSGDLTVVSLASCQYGTVTFGPGTGLYCAPPPA